MKREKHNLIGTKAFRKGSYSTVIMVVIIAIVIAANVMFSKLPTAARNIDVSSNNLYSIGDTTHSVLDGLKNDVEIIVIKDKERIREFQHYLLNMPIIRTISRLHIRIRSFILRFLPHMIQRKTISLSNVMPQIRPQKLHSVT